MGKFERMITDRWDPSQPPFGTVSRTTLAEMLLHLKCPKYAE